MQAYAILFAKKDIIFPFCRMFAASPTSYLSHLLPRYHIRPLSLLDIYLPVLEIFTFGRLRMIYVLNAVKYLGRKRSLILFEYFAGSIFRNDGITVLCSGLETRNRKGKTCRLCLLCLTIPRRRIEVD